MSLETSHSEAAINANCVNTALSPIMTANNSSTITTNCLAGQPKAAHVVPRDMRIELGEITSHNLKQLRIINENVFPVTYNDKFYRDILLVGNLAKFVYCNDIVVGAVCCRKEMEDSRLRLYIMTLGCLAPYRRLGIGSVMLQYVLDICHDDRAIHDVYLHVKIDNNEAIEFYKTFDFEIVGIKEGYYNDIEPPDAYVLQKNMEHLVNNNTTHVNGVSDGFAPLSPSAAATTLSMATKPVSKSLHTNKPKH